MTGERACCPHRKRRETGGNPGDRRDVPRFLHATEPKEKPVNLPSVPTFPRKSLPRIPRGLKPKSKQTTYRSGEPPRHPKAEFFSKLWSSSPHRKDTQTTD